MPRPSRSVPRNGMVPRPLRCGPWNGMVTRPSRNFPRNGMVTRLPRSVLRMTKRVKYMYMYRVLPPRTCTPPLTPCILTTLGAPSPVHDCQLVLIIPTYNAY